jgi:hypothetical protein
VSYKVSQLLSGYSRTTTTSPAPFCLCFQTQVPNWNFSTDIKCFCYMLSKVHKLPPDGHSRDILIVSKAIFWQGKQAVLFSKMSSQSVPHLLYSNKPPRVLIKQVICIRKHKLLKANIWLNFLKCFISFFFPHLHSHSNHTRKLYNR